MLLRNFVRKPSITTYLIKYGSNNKGVDSVQYSSNVEEKLYGNLYDDVRLKNIDMTKVYN